MTKNSSERSQSVKPSQLKVGDTILHNGQPAQITKIGSWRDSVHGTVYGLDLIAKGKTTRASFVESGRVKLVA